jgi:hypothetical protein
MGRFLLTTFALATLLACSQGNEPGAAGRSTATGSNPAAAVSRAANPHSKLACAACHRGASADRGHDAVPGSACEASGCQADGGPTEATIGSVTFQHQHHGHDQPVQASCAGCHTHDAGNEPLKPSVDACALCHLSQVQSASAEDCRLCHQKSDHVEHTSQGVPIPHSSLPWIETGCVRCHYDVAKPPVAVPMSRCSQCHTDLEQLTREGIGEDLHPAHTGIVCTACHDSGTHTVQAMSSAVDLVCANCHEIAHGRRIGSSEAVSRTCDACHGTVHRAEQELFLGVLPGIKEALPSAKFLAGLTCRSCHVPPASGEPSATPVRATAQACAGCHPPQYEIVLSWWRQGLQQKQKEAATYVAAAARTLAGARSDSVAKLLGSADTMLGLVRRAGGEHNLELSDRIFRWSVERAQTAYALAGKTAPPPPEFGIEPHAGLCSYCHYRANEPWDFSRMSQKLHADIMDQVRMR